MNTLLVLKPGRQGHTDKSERPPEPAAGELIFLYLSLLVCAGCFDILFELTKKVKTGKLMTSVL